MFVSNAGDNVEIPAIACVKKLFVFVNLTGTNTIAPLTILGTYNVFALSNLLGVSKLLGTIEVVKYWLLFVSIGAFT
jgi:hypothetical protein